MTCAEFQKVLPYIIETGGNAEEEAHLRACPICSDLVTDLKYIAEQAKLLLPMHEPSPKVWEDIKGSLEREGLIDKPARARGGLLSPKRKTKKLWLAGGTAMLLIAFASVLYQRNDSGQNAGGAAVESPADMAFAADLSATDDQNLLKAIAAADPDLRPTFENELQRVDSYISDAQTYWKSHPGDDEARVHLIDAYDQKAVVYQMAISRSTR